MKVRKNPSAQRASKAPFLMEIIWSILRSAFLPRREMQWSFVHCEQAFFLEQRGIELLLAHFTRCF